MMSESILAANLLSLFQSMHGKDPMSEKDYADSLAKIITDHIKTAEVQAGIAVSTTGTPATHTGMTTNTGKIL